jgi:secreted trypsin-like serine protease
MLRNSIAQILILSLFFINLDAKITCGSAGTATSFLINGTQSDQGQWPWLVGLFLFENNKFFCGGTLISENMIITVNKKLNSLMR